MYVIYALFIVEVAVQLVSHSVVSSACLLAIPFGGAGRPLSRFSKWGVEGRRGHLHLALAGTTCLLPTFGQVGIVC